MDRVNHTIGGSMRVQTALLVCLLPLLAQAAPPDVPTELKAKPGQLVRVTVKTTQDIGTLRNFKDAEAFWGELVSPPGRREFLFQAPIDAKPGTQYVIGWWTPSEKEGVATTITVDGKPGFPDTPTDPPVKPDPKPPTTDIYYFLAVRQDQNTQEFEKLMRLPAWDELKAKGHTVADTPVSFLPAGIDKPTTLPSLVVLRRNADGKTWTPSKTVAMPTTDEQVRGLLK